MQGQGRRRIEDIEPKAKTKKHLFFWNNTFATRGVEDHSSHNLGRVQEFSITRNTHSTPSHVARHVDQFNPRLGVSQSAALCRLIMTTGAFDTDNSQRVSQVQKTSQSNQRPEIFGCFSRISFLFCCAIARESYFLEPLDEWRKC